MVSKFPPIEGGIASRTYWLARQLGEEGISVDVVTNAVCCEPEYKIVGCEDCLSSLLNVTIHDLSVEAPWHIPSSPDYLERLSSLLLNTVRTNNSDLIDSGYLVPYGIAGWLVSKITGLPHVVRHGCSDILKLLSDKQYSDLLTCVLRDASVVISTPQVAPKLIEIGARVIVQEEYVPDARFFRFKERRNSKPVFAYIGKVNFHWYRRGLGEIVTCFESIPEEECDLVFAAQGLGLENFRDTIGEPAAERMHFRNFVPPWEMPSLLGQVDFLFDFAVDDPISSRSFIVEEAIATGVHILSNKPSQFGLQTLTQIAPDDLNTAIISGLHSEQNSGQSTLTGSSKEWVQQNINLYETVV